jgi:hypothetical protein
MKRGQVTVFIIVGMVILLAVSLMFLFNSILEGDSVETDSVESQGAAFVGNAVQMYVESCIEQVGDDAITFVAEHGGYYDLPQFSYKDLPYYLYENRNTIISKNELQHQLSNYMSDEFFFCIQNFDVFESEYDIEQGDVTTETTVSKEHVVFDVTFPLVVNQGAITREMTSFSRSLRSQIGTVHSLITDFMQHQEDDPETLCLGCLKDIVEPHDMRVEILPFEEGEMIFTFYDDVETPLLEYTFVNKYPFEELGEVEDE